MRFIWQRARILIGVWAGVEATPFVVDTAIETMHPVVARHQWLNALLARKMRPYVVLCLIRARDKYRGIPHIGHIREEGRRKLDLNAITRE